MSSRAARARAVGLRSVPMTTPVPTPPVRDGPYDQSPPPTMAWRVGPA